MTAPLLSLRRHFRKRHKGADGGLPDELSGGELGVVHGESDDETFFSWCQSGASFELIALETSLDDLEPNALKTKEILKKLGSPRATAEVPFFRTLNP